MYILGVSAFYHDSAAALLKDGEVIAAAQEERFTRIKHDQEWPENAISFCLRYAGITEKDLDHVVFYDKPFLKFDRLLHSYLETAPTGLISFLRSMPVWLKQKIWTKSLIQSKFPELTSEILFTRHHHSHAASAFYPSPFEEAAVLTVDGVGEWAGTSIHKGKGSSLRLIREINFPHTPGLLYSAFTYYCGFRVNSGEYKLMGLAPYGKPVYTDLILERLMDLKEDGSFRLDMKYFNYLGGLTMTGRRFHRLFGGEPRKPEGPLEQRHLDIAASIQEVTDRIMLRLARHAQKVCDTEYLCLAGGVALNCVSNGKILRDGIFRDLWVQPAAGDAGGALGAALAVWHDHLKNPRTPGQSAQEAQKGSYLGPEYSDDFIRNFLEVRKIPYRELDRTDLMRETAELLAGENVVGWFQGRMEFGPRALGNRSILGDARSASMQKTMNLKIKFRESFRPFAPSVRAEEAGRYFDLDRPSPFMLIVADIHESQKLRPDHEAEGLAQLDLIRSRIPAVTHVDNSARIQTVHRETNPLFHGLLTAFKDLTGSPVLINTSFNVRGEPIVENPEQAYSCFMATGMDALVMGSFLLTKAEQPTVETEIRGRNFQPD